MVFIHEGSAVISLAGKSLGLLLVGKAQSS